HRLLEPRREEERRREPAVRQERRFLERAFELVDRAWRHLWPFYGGCLRTALWRQRRGTRRTGAAVPPPLPPLAARARERAGGEHLGEVPFVLGRAGEVGRRLQRVCSALPVVLRPHRRRPDARPGHRLALLAHDRRATDDGPVLRPPVEL